MDPLTEDEIFAGSPPRRGSILIVGVGAVGSLIADELVHAGYGPLVLIDHDILESHNLHRHRLGAEYLKQPKAPALAEFLSSGLPTASVYGIQADFTKLTPEQKIGCVRLVDLVISATNSLECQLEVNRVCLLAEKEAVFPGVWVEGTSAPSEVGEIQYVFPGNNTPCYQCATLWRIRRGVSTEGRAGPRVGLQVLVTATVQVIAAIMDPTANPGLIDPQHTLMLVHGIEPPSSNDVRMMFRGRGVRYLRIELPPTPCPTCRQVRRADARTAGSNGPAPQFRRNRMPGTELSGRDVVRMMIPSLVFIAIVVFAILLVISRHNAGNTRRAAASAAEKAAVEQAALDGAVDCYVVLGDGPGGTEDVIAANKHYPYSGVPLARADHSDSYWIVVSVTGVSAQTAGRQNISLHCSNGMLGRDGSSDVFANRGELQAYFGVSAGGIEDGPPEPVDCTVRSGDNVIRKMHIDLALDEHRRFEQ